jgi:hypothetical protein
VTIIDTPQAVTEASAQVLLFDPSKLTTLKKRQTPSVADLLALGSVEKYDPRFLRNVPVQKRSVDRLKNIVRIIEILIEDTMIGRDSLTTAMVVEAVEMEGEELAKLMSEAKKEIGGAEEDATSEIKMSIGTVYRYFEDDIAMLDYVDPHRVLGLSRPTTGS